MSTHDEKAHKVGRLCEDADAIEVVDRDTKEERVIKVGEQSKARTEQSMRENSKSQYRPIHNNDSDDDGN